MQELGEDMGTRKDLNTRTAIGVGLRYDAKGGAGEGKKGV
jgi:hypothetical protein